MAMYPPPRGLGLKCSRREGSASPFWVTQCLPSPFQTFRYLIHGWDGMKTCFVVPYWVLSTLKQIRCYATMTFRYHPQTAMGLSFELKPSASIRSTSPDSSTPTSLQAESISFGNPGPNSVFCQSMARRLHGLATVVATGAGGVVGPWAEDLPACCSTCLSPPCASAARASRARPADHDTASQCCEDVSEFICRRTSKLQAHRLAASTWLRLSTKQPLRRLRPAFPQQSAPHWQGA